MNGGYQRPDLTRRGFATTNTQTIAHRVQLLQEFLPQTASIGELCCGDCRQQWQAYVQQAGIQCFCGLDIDSIIVERNRSFGIDCQVGDVLDAEVMRHFLAYDVLFFGPPLSIDCDGHRLLTYAEVKPSYTAVAQLLWNELDYAGTLVCICPKSTTMGEITWLWRQLQSYRSDIALPLIHHSYATQTGTGAETELRLKYIELWFSRRLADGWLIRESRG